MTILDFDLPTPSPRQTLIDLFDLAALVPCRIVIRESNHPGALAALQTWAKLHHRNVERYDLRPTAQAIDYEVEIACSHSITVTERP